MSDTKNISTEIILKTTARFSVVSHINQEQAWKKLRLDNQRFLFRPEILGKVAASIGLLIVSALLIYQTTQVEVSTAYAQRIEHVLPDGSSVLMDADSELSYNKLTWKLNRSLAFNGQGYFQVTHGNKFEVITKKGSVAVLGTKFHVNDRDKFAVSCEEGKVKVSKPQAVPRILIANETISEKWQVTKSQPELTTWKNGTYFFKRKPLRQVLEEIERQFDVEIHYGSLTGEYTGSFDNKNLMKTLRRVCTPMGLQFEKVDNKIFLTKNESNV